MLNPKIILRSHQLSRLYARIGRPLSVRNRRGGTLREGTRRQANNQNLKERYSKCENTALLLNSFTTVVVYSRTRVSIRQKKMMPRMSAHASTCLARCTVKRTQKLHASTRTMDRCCRARNAHPCRFSRAVCFAQHLQGMTKSKEIGYGRRQRGKPPRIASNTRTRKRT